MVDEAKSENQGIDCAKPEFDHLIFKQNVEHGQKKHQELDLEPGKIVGPSNLLEPEVDLSDERFCFHQLVVEI